MARRFLSVAIAGLIVAVTTGLVLSHARTPPLATTVPTGPSATLAANDWSVLSPLLTSAIERAKHAAQERGRTELEDWRRQVMLRVDPGFLDDHLSYVNKRGDDVKWLWRRLLDGQQEADRQYLQSVADALNAKVFDPAQVQAELDLVANAMGEAFTKELTVTLAAMRGEVGRDPAKFDARLEQVVFAGADRTESISLKSIVTDPDAAGAMTQRVARQIKQEMGHSRSQDGEGARSGKDSCARLLGRSGRRTGLQSGPLSRRGQSCRGSHRDRGRRSRRDRRGGWARMVGNHSQHVNEARPRLKEQIERSLHDFTEATLKDDGRFGVGLDAFAVKLAHGVRQQETAWGRIATRVQAFLDL